jgi:zinc protease
LNRGLAVGVPPALGRVAVSRVGTRPARQDKGGGAGGFSLTAAKRVVLPNGLKLILLEDHRLLIVVARAEVADVTLREPAEKAGVAALTGGLLEEGTDQHTGKEIAALIEDTGGSLGFTSSRAGLKVLTPDTNLGLGLMFECLTRPAFPAEAFERVKDQQLSAIDDALTQPRTKARMLFSAAVYGEHPYGRPAAGTRATVEKLTAADCKEFHRLAFAPNFVTVVVVGDFKADEMAKKVEALTKNWKKSDAATPAPAAPPKATALIEKLVSDPEAAQVHVYLGHLGIKRNNPDYHKLLVMDYVLGTGTGFTDRLSANLRDRQGLAYTVSANISGSAGLQPGTFTGYIGTFPDKYTWVRDAFLKEIAKIRDEPPTAQEVDDAKTYLTGSLPFRFASLSDVAGELADAERYGLGFDYLETFRKEVGAVTPADVQAVAKKYLDPKTLTLVAVGPIDKAGKALPPKKDE